MVFLRISYLKFCFFIAVFILCCSIADSVAGAAESPINKVRLTWPLVPSAVKYQVVILRSDLDYESNIALTIDQIFTNGVEVDLSRFGDAKEGFYWKYCPLNFEGKPLGHFSKPKPITEGTAINPTAPLPTTEFAQMADFPLYPVYSWVPTCGAKHHEVQIYRQNKETGRYNLIREIMGEEYTAYEYSGYTVPGEYYWRVRSVTEGGTPLSDWSEESHFRIKDKVTVAALGDSITHGGGAMSVPPGYCLYDWETYSPVPIKNLGLSGNTTEMMLKRFKTDVLPFHPKILVIMGGVNDFRGETFGWSIVQNLAAIRDLCYSYSIVPVFATVTPINAYMLELRGVEFAPSDWKVHQEFVNDWVMKQKYHVDVSTALTDDDGNLRSMYSTDGLHPDFYGKKHIGETIGRYLLQHFPNVVG